MIWGATAKSRERQDASKRYVIAISNRRLQKWHEFFTWWKVELLDGRFARFCWLERKVVLTLLPGSLKNETLDGSICILELKQKWPDAADFVYRVRGSMDDIVEPGDEQLSIRKDVLKAMDEYDVLAVPVPDKSRREAVLAQKERGKESANE